jgi:hypothetical protein
VGPLWTATVARNGHTADLSTPLRSGRDDKGWGRCGPQLSARNGRTADLSTPLRSGRDDNGEVGASRKKLLNRYEGVGLLRK